MSDVKTFDDLVFERHAIAEEVAGALQQGIPHLEKYANAKQARMTFPNAWGVSVLSGDAFYTSPGQSYEVGITRWKSLVHEDQAQGIGFESRVLGWQTKDQVTEIMAKLQALPA